MKKIDEKYFINRELSWLDFNSRVLEEAGDPNVPILDRFKFAAIFSNNLDEFFMVRVAAVKKARDISPADKDPAGLTPKMQFERIRKKTKSLVKRQYQLLCEKLLPELKRSKIALHSYKELNLLQKKELSNYFDNDVMPVLTPVAVDPSHPFPMLNNCTIEIAVELKKPKSKKSLKAFVEVPKMLPRFIPLHERASGMKSSYVMLEDVILNNIEKLFSKCEILNTCLFRITRDMNIGVDEDGDTDLLLEMEKTLKRRKRRALIRLETLAGSDVKLKNWLEKQLELAPEAVFNINGPLDLSRFFELTAKEADSGLLEKDWPTCEHPEISLKVPVFDSIKKERGICLFHPFQSFNPVVRFLEEASLDPEVLAIKQTLYRVSGDSPIVEALQRAAENGKQVTVIVELKARFDEDNNINWARRLEESGAHVIYGIAGLKIHCKALLVIRRESGGIHRYAHLSTGNYNDKTAKLYTDTGFFTDDLNICADVASLFNVVTGYSEFQESEKIVVAPFNLRKRFISLIEREARLSTPHRPGRIIVKMNSLVDPEIIEKLYQAAFAGVKIDLIVRGICCLKPGIGTNNIHVISIIDRYLEHSRIYYFENGGNPDYFMSSADWMPRNLNNRIELMFPIESPKLRAQIDEIFKIELRDKIKARRLRENGKYSHSKTKNRENTRSQKKTHDFFKAMIQKKSTRRKLSILKRKK